MNKPETHISYKEELSRLGHKTEQLEFEGIQCLIVGEIPEDIKYEILGHTVSYRRKGSDCFDATEQEIKTNKANGCFLNTFSPRHVFPAIIRENLFIGYDEPLDKEVNTVIFSGSEIQVGKAAEDFYSIGDYPYGRHFIFQTEVG